MPEWLDTALRHYAALLRQELGSRLLDVRLFGSWAQHRAHDESDIDVWVLIDRLDEVTRDVPFRATTPVLMKHGVVLSPTVMDATEWDLLQARERRFARDILTEGVPL